MHRSERHGEGCIHAPPLQRVTSARVVYDVVVLVLTTLRVDLDDARPGLLLWISRELVEVVCCSQDAGIVTH